MMSMEVALVSSSGQNTLRIISPDKSKKSQDIGNMTLLGHEAEYHYHSLEPVVSTRFSQSAVDYLIDKYGEGKITKVQLRVREEIPERSIRYTCK